MYDNAYHYSSGLGASSGTCKYSAGTANNIVISLSQFGPNGNTPPCNRAFIL